jgi:hypothetical protein
VKDVTTTHFPDCDMCLERGESAARLGRYNAPTKLGPWANLCDPCFAVVGIDSSVTERRVHPDHPFEVLAIARRWSGQLDKVAIVRHEGSPRTWRFSEAEDGFLYAVHAPREPFPVFEDSGRPCGTIIKDEWLVRCLNDAPDSFFGVREDGLHATYDGFLVEVW